MRDKKNTPVTVWLDRQTYKLLLKLASEDFNTAEYELNLAIRKGLELMTGEEIDEDE